MSGNPISPAAIVTMGEFTNQRVKIVDASGQATYSPSSTPNQYSGWLYWQDNYSQSFGLDGTDNVFANYDLSDYSDTTGGFEVGGASDVQAQDLYDYNLSADPPYVYVENQFNDWKTLVTFPTSSLPDPANGPIYLTVTADHSGPTGNTVDVGWFSVDSTKFDFTRGQDYYKATTNAAGSINLNGGTSYRINVTQAVADFLKHSPSSTADLAFLLSTDATGTALSGVNAELDTQPAATYPVIKPSNLQDTADGGASVDYTLTGTLPQGKTPVIGLYWSPTSSFDPSTATATSAGFAVEQTHNGPATFTAAQLGTPPAGTKYLLAVADAGHFVTDPQTPPAVASTPHGEPTISITGMEFVDNGQDVQVNYSETGDTQGASADLTFYASDQPDLVTGDPNQIPTSVSIPVVTGGDGQATVSLDSLLGAINSAAKYIDVAIQNVSLFEVGKPDDSVPLSSPSITLNAIAGVPSASNPILARVSYTITGGKLTTDVPIVATWSTTPSIQGAIGSPKIVATIPAGTQTDNMMGPPTTISLTSSASSLGKPPYTAKYLILVAKPNNPAQVKMSDPVVFHWAFDPQTFADTYNSKIDPPFTSTQKCGLQFLLGNMQSDSRIPDIRYIAYMLATVEAEHGNFLPGQESKSLYNKHVWKIYSTYPFEEFVLGPDAKLLRHFSGPHLRFRFEPDYAMRVPAPDGHFETYYGRGYIQLTWQENYLRAGRALNIGGSPDALADDPSLAMDPQNAYNIMVWWMTEGSPTGDALSDHINGNDADYLGARAIINPYDKNAQDVADNAQDYQRILSASEYYLPVNG
jgi:hypothetical protein